jgi:hypothetical protein
MVVEMNKNATLNYFRNCLKCGLLRGGGGGVSQGKRYKAKKLHL